MWKKQVRQKEKRQGRRGKKTKKSDGRKVWYGILFAGAVLSAGAGILLPGKLLGMQSDAQLNQVSAVPAIYYLEASASMARTASSNLERSERLQLISGKWKSKCREASVYEMQMQDYEAVNIARQEVQKLYEAGIYPRNISSEYGRWYTWNAVPYKAVDTTFHTYTAYFWKIVFNKYDGKEDHIVYVLEDGTVFYMEVNFDGVWEEDYLQKMFNYYQDEKPQINVIMTKWRNFAEYIPYPTFAEEESVTDEKEKDRLLQIVESSEPKSEYSVFKIRDEKTFFYALVPKG